MAAPASLRATRLQQDLWLRTTVCSIHSYLILLLWFFFSSGYPHTICRRNPALWCCHLQPLGPWQNLVKAGTRMELAWNTQWGQHGLNNHPSPLQGRILQMWPLLPLFVGSESTDSSRISSWNSLEQQRDSMCGWMTRRMLWGVCSLEADWAI